MFSTHESESASGFNFNCLTENEGLFEVIGGYVHCGSGNISEMAQDGDVVILWTTNRK